MSELTGSPGLDRLGRYDVLRRIAAGGMAEIFLGRQQGIDGIERLVVLKRILPHVENDPFFLEMFLDEARIMSSLHHSNIVQIIDMGKDGEVPFLAMELLKGQDLRRLTRTAEERKVKIGLEHDLTIAIGVCAALHFAHEAVGPDGKPLEIIHRDVSPHNIFVTYDGGVKLMDFGIAKAATTRRAKTRDGVRKGKVSYMAPEQFASTEIDRRADIFSLGIVLWEMTTGRRLFKRENELLTMKRIVEMDALPPSQLVSDYPPELEGIVLKALSRDPAKRYETAEALQLALEEFAREKKLAISNVTLARLMKELFVNELQSWTVARAQSSYDDLLDRLAEDLKTEVTDPVGPATHPEPLEQSTVRASIKDVLAAEAEADAAEAEAGPSAGPDASTVRRSVPPPEEMADLADRPTTVHSKSEDMFEKSTVRSVPPPVPPPPTTSAKPEMPAGTGTQAEAKGIDGLEEQSTIIRSTPPPVMIEPELAELTPPPLAADDSPTNKAAKPPPVPEDAPLAKARKTVPPPTAAPARVDPTELVSLVNERRRRRRVALAGAAVGALAMLIVIYQAADDEPPSGGPEPAASAAPEPRPEAEPQPPEPPPPRPPGPTAPQPTAQAQPEPEPAPQPQPSAQAPGAEPPPRVVVIDRPASVRPDPAAVRAPAGRAAAGTPPRPAPARPAPTLARARAARPPAPAPAPRPVAKKREPTVDELDALLPSVE